MTRLRRDQMFLAAMAVNVITAILFAALGLPRIAGQTVEVTQVSERAPSGTAVGSSPGSSAPVPGASVLAAPKLKRGTAGRGQLPTVGISRTEIKLGTITGVAAGLDYSYTAKSIAAYFQKVNAEGGVNGRTLKLITYDDGFGLDTNRTISVTKKLVEEDKVFSLVGPMYILSFPAVAKYLADRDVPVVGPDGAHPEQFKWSNVYHINTPTEVLARSNARYVVRELRKPRIAFFYLSNIAVYEAYRVEFSKELQKLGGEIAYQQGLNAASDPSCTPPIIQARGRDIDMMVLFLNQPLYVRCLQEMERQSYRPTVLTVGNVAMDESVTREVGDFMQGVYSNAAFEYDPRSPQVQEYRRTLHRYYPGTELSALGYQVYISSKYFVEALRRIPAGALSREALYAAMESIKTWTADGSMHPVSWSATVRAPNRYRKYYQSDGSGWRAVSGWYEG